jgi:hypothetical protein
MMNDRHLKHGQIATEKVAIVHLTLQSAKFNTHSLESGERIAQKSQHIPHRDDRHPIAIADGKSNRDDPGGCPALSTAAAERRLRH